MSAPFVIVGGGPAGAYAARALAERGRRIVLLTAEADPPYDRTVLTKSWLVDDAIALPPLWPAQAPWVERIEVRTSSVVSTIDPPAHTVLLASGEVLRYTALLLATGAEPRRLGGLDVGHVLRTAADLRGLRAKLPDSGRILVVGGGVIGLEAAASLRSRGYEVDVLEAGPRVLGRGVPAVVATWLADRHARAGVNVRTNAAPNGIPPGYAVVVVGVGVTPRVGLAQAAGIHCDDGIVTDDLGRTDAPDVYAAGDCARWAGVRHEAWNVAGEQGAAVGATMAGEPRAWVGPASTWSDQYDVTLQAAGTAQPGDDEIVLTGTDSVLVLTVDAGGRLTSATGVGVGIAIARPVRLAQRVIGVGGAVDVGALRALATAGRPPTEVVALLRAAS